MKIAASVIACAALAGVTAARALNPTFDVNQYGHTAWRVDEGFAPGAIHDLAQTPDGYLWLATDSGLVRFDGVRTTAWEPPGNASLPDPHVQRLYVSRDGKLWIRHPRGEASTEEMGNDAFSVDFPIGTVTFTRNPHHEINAMLVSTNGPVRNLRFARAEIRTTP